LAAGQFAFGLGRYDDAFADLRLAASSNRIFLPVVIVAWGIRTGTQSCEQLIGQEMKDKNTVRAFSRARG
jgi:hypothetical protein